MNTIFMNSENSETSDPHRLLLNLTDKINVKGSDKYVALSNMSIYYSWKNIRMWYKNNIFKAAAPRWNEEFELSDGSHSISDIQVCFEYILKKHGEKTINLSIRIYLSKIESCLKTKAGNYLKLLTPETVKLLGKNKIRITKGENGGNVPHLEITE